MSHTEIPNFCESCGGHLSPAPAGDPFGAPLICESCGRRIYLDPKTAVAMVLNYQDRIVLLRRAQQDEAFAKWILPGGHVDRGEVVPEAAVREAIEETGLEVELDGLLGVYSYVGNPVALIVYHGRAFGRMQMSNQEALEIGTFEHGQIPWNHLGYRSTGDALRDYLAMRGEPGAETT